MDRSLRAELNSFFEKFSDLSDRAVEYWPLSEAKKDADEDDGIGYELKTITSKEEFQTQGKLIRSFFDLCASSKPFSGKKTRSYEEIESILNSSVLKHQAFRISTFLIIGHIPGEVKARAGCIMQYFYASRTIFIESIWLADDLQKHVYNENTGKNELVVKELQSEHDELDEKVRERNREKNQQTVLSWMLTYRNPEQNKQSALLDLVKKLETYQIESVFLEVENPTALVAIPPYDKDELYRAAKRLSAFYAIEAQYIKFAYERPVLDAVRDRSCFLLALPQIRKKKGELVIESNVVMKFIIDYGKLLMGNAYKDDRYEDDLKACGQFRANAYTRMDSSQNGTDAISSNNKSLFENRLTEHNTVLYLHSVPRLEQPRFAYRRSSVSFEILVDEDYFEPHGLDAYHDMVPPEPKRTKIGHWLSIVRKEWNPPKYGVPKPLYCPVAHSGETDLFAYKYQTNPPYYTRYYSIEHAEVNVEFPSHFEFTSEGRMETFYRLPQTDEHLRNVVSKQRTQIEQSIKNNDVLPQFTYSVRMEACVSYTYFLKSAVRVWHLVLKPISDDIGEDDVREYDISELEIIKLMRFFSGSQEHGSEEERRESVRRIKFSVINEGKNSQAEDSSNNFKKFWQFVYKYVPLLKFRPAIHYYGEKELTVQKWAWRAKIFGQIIFWLTLGMIVLGLLLFILPSVFQKMFDGWSPIGALPAIGYKIRGLESTDLNPRPWSWPDVFLAITYWLVAIYVLSKVWQWLFSTLFLGLREIGQVIKNQYNRLFILPDKNNKKTSDKADNLIELLRELTGVHYERSNNSRLRRQMDEDDQIVSLRNVRSGVVEIDTGDISPVPDKADENDMKIDATSFLGFYDNAIKAKSNTNPVEPSKSFAKISLSKRNEIRSKVKELYKNLHEGNIKMEEDAEPFTVEEYARYVFETYCGICLGIFDYDRMGIQEIGDTLVPLTDSKNEDSFISIHRGVLAMLGHNDDVMETFWDTLGINAYLLIPSAVLAHNDMVSRDADSRLDKLLNDLREGRSKLSVRQLNLERNYIDDLLNDDILGNVFQYKTEKEIYEEGMQRRGITERIKDDRSKLEQLDKLINEKQEAGSTRYQRRITFLATLVGIFSSYQYIHDYFQNELAVAVDSSGVEKIAYEDIPFWFKIPAEIIDYVTSIIPVIPQILPHKGCYDPLDLAHDGLGIAFTLLFGYLLIVNLADPGRNKKYFWQRSTSRSRSLPKTNASIPKTR